MTLDLDAALSALPLFPLHSAVLFPGALLPLHVFEPRYRTMIADVLAGNRALAVVHVPDAHADMSGNPPIAEIAGVGTIVEHKELAGGRYHIMLIGRARVRLQELSFEAPYRRALATVVRSEGSATGASLAALHTAIATFTRLVAERDDSFKLRFPKDADPGAIADACASQLIISPIERQRALETRDVEQRVRHVTEVLTVQRAMLAPDTTTVH